MNYLLTSESIVMFLNGKPTKVSKESAAYAKIIKALSLPAFEQEAEILEILAGANPNLNIEKSGFVICGEEVSYKGNDLPKPLAQKILSLIRENLPVTIFEKFWETTPFSPPSGQATGSFNGLHTESKFLAAIPVLHPIDAGRLPVSGGGVWSVICSTSFVTLLARSSPVRTLSLSRPAALAVVGGLLFACVPAFAASVINLDTGISETVEQGGSGSFTFTMTNVGTSVAPDNFIGWVLGIQLVPRVGNTGSLTVGSLSGGAINPMPTGSLDITQPVLSTLGSSATINGLTQYYFMGINTLDTLGTLAVGQTYEMGSLGLTASGDASGTWDVYTVQQNSPLFKTYFFDGTAFEQPFGNMPWVGEGNYSLKLGEVAAVPEPSTLAMLGLAGFGAWRRRGRRLAVAGGTVVA